MSAQPSTLRRENLSATETAPIWGIVPADQTITAPAATIDTAAHTVSRPVAVLALAWSAEEPDDVADPIDSAWHHSPAKSAPVPPRYLRTGLLVAAGALAVVASAGLILSLHGGGASVAVPAGTSSSATPSVTVHVAPPTTPEAAPPPPMATPTVIADQVASVPRHPQSSTPHVQHTTPVYAPSAPPAPVPTNPPWTPKPIEHWPPDGSTEPKPPTWGNHPSVDTGNGGNGSSGTGKGDGDTHHES
jgi:hypothetical protein